MGFARVFSAQPVFLEARCVTVETDVSNAECKFSVVGLTDKAIDESRERVSAAIKNTGLPSPLHTNKRVIVSLAPADLHKEGPRFDLPIALSYLLATGNISFDTNGILFLGELSLQGNISPVHGVLAIARYAQQHHFHTIVVPYENADEASLITGITVIPAYSLTSILDHFDESGARVSTKIVPHPQTSWHDVQETCVTDFCEVCGQESAKRGIEIAAAGKHNIVLYGPPGTGKTLLARALQGILPPLSLHEALEATAIHSVAGMLCGKILTKPPFRAPHHSASHVAIVGGGTIPKPGEVTLAHRGVLFLDEFPEFERRVIDGLREPLEDKVVSVSRAKGNALFPANFMLVAAMNPNRERGVNRMNDIDRERLKKKISGPVIDRIDMWIEVSHVKHEKLRTQSKAVVPESPRIRERVIEARTIQHVRFNDPIKTNGDMNIQDLRILAHLSPVAEATLICAAEKMNLSPRSYHRTIKLARTIADLAQCDTIEEAHVMEALSYRPRELFD